MSNNRQLIACWSKLTEHADINYLLRQTDWSCFYFIRLIFVIVNSCATHGQNCSILLAKIYCNTSRCLNRTSGSIAGGTVVGWCKRMRRKFYLWWNRQKKISPLKLNCLKIMTVSVLFFLLVIFLFIFSPPHTKRGTVLFSSTEK